MDYESLVKELNLAVSSGEKRKSKGDFCVARFYCADVFTKIKELHTTHAPSGKVAIIASKESFSKDGLALINVIRSSGGQAVNVVVDKDIDFSTDEVCGLFRLAEDVRLAIVLDYQLFDLAAYFATIRNIPLIQVVREFSAKGLLAKRVYIKNGKGVDSFGVSAPRHVIFSGDVMASEQTVANVYAYCASKIVALFDYRISGVIKGGTPNKEAYHLARSSVLGALDLDIKDANFKQKLLSFAVKLEIADNMADGKLINLSAPSIAEFIAFGRFGASPLAELTGACIALELYEKCFNGKTEKVVLPTNYLERASELSRLIPIDEKELLKNFKTQTTLLNFKRNKIELLKESMRNDLSSTARLAPKIMDTYLKLGGKGDIDTAMLSKAVKLSGDTSLSLNGMSLVREEGLLEN